MLKKILFGLIFAFGLWSISACVPLPPPNGTQTPAVNSPTIEPSIDDLIEQIKSTGDSCTSINSVDLEKAAKANAGAYFWAFFINFKDREFEFGTFAPPSQDAWPAKLKISGCFKLYGRQNSESSSDNDIFIEIGEKEVPCYWTNAQNNRQWIKPAGLNKIKVKFNDDLQSPLPEPPKVTAVVFDAQDRIVCDFNFKQLVEDVYLSGIQKLDNGTDRDKFVRAVDEIDVKLIDGVSITSELFPYLSIKATGSVSSSVSTGNIIVIEPVAQGESALSQCCEPVSLIVQNQTNPRLGGFAAILKGQQFSSSQSPNPCAYRFGVPVTLEAHFQPATTFIASGESTAEILQRHKYQTDYIVHLSRTHLNDVDQPQSCDALGTPTQQPVQFWPYTSTVTIGGGFQGTLIEVWFDPDDAGRK